MVGNEVETELHGLVVLEEFLRLVAHGGEAERVGRTGIFKVAQDVVVEAHQRHLALITFEDLEHRLGEPVVVAVAFASLDLDHQRHPAGDEGKHMLQRRHLVLGRPDRKHAEFG